MNNREKILETTKNLIIKEGFHGCSMKRIVEESGVSTGGVYYHFKSKDEIINELYTIIKRELLTMIHANTNSEDASRVFIKKLWYAKIKWSKENYSSKHFLDIYYESPYKHTEINDEIVQSYEKLVKIVQRAVTDGDIINMEADYFFDDLDSSIKVTLKYIEKHPDKDNEEFLDFAFRKYWRSVVNFN